MGIFKRRKHEEPTPVAESTSQEQNQVDEIPQSVETEQESSALPQHEKLREGSGLHQLVEIMRSKGTGQQTLELKQSGNDMNLGFFQDGAEKESTVVVPGNEWFNGVAKLYTEEEKSERGPWNRALIVVDSGINDNYSVQASFMNTETRTNHNLQYGELSQHDDVADHATAETDLEESVQDDAQHLTPAQRILASSRSNPDAPTVSNTRADRENDNFQVADETEGTLDTKEVEEDRLNEGPKPISAADLPSAETAIAAREKRDAQKRKAETYQSDIASETDLASGIATGTAVGAGAGSLAVSRNSDSDYTQAHDTSFASATLPDHVSDDWEDDEVETTEASRANEDHADRLPAGESSEVPSNAEGYDIAPSYHKPAQPVAKPSTSAKAEGNLVLTEAEVVSRLVDVQEALFGANGSARDVSTVLIRVRALGSYYDALTHVRESGLWAQKKTFDLVSEDVLNILQLKADSYKEGAGSPLAISLRFTPGIPPVASFDYENEEAFVSYSDHLPAQQYVEELRMFPRTGANIPSHMNQALTSWTF